MTNGIGDIKHEEIKNLFGGALNAAELKKHIVDRMQDSSKEHLQQIFNILFFYLKMFKSVGTFNERKIEVMLLLYQKELLEDGLAY